MSRDAIARAEKAFHAGDVEGAARECEAVLARDPRNPAATLLLGLSCARMGRHEDALASLRAALESNPNDYVALSWLPTVLRRAARLDEAYAVGKKACTLWPDDVDLWVSLSHTCLALRLIGEGAECLQKAIKLRPQDPAIRRSLGIAYELLGRDEEAAEQFRRAVRLDPASEANYARLGRLLMGHGNFVQTIELCRSALRVLPRSAQVHLLLAQALRAVQEGDLATAHLRTAIDLDPAIELSAGLWLQEEGKFDEANDLFLRSIEHRPKQGVAYFALLKGRKASEADRPLIDTMRALLADSSVPTPEQAALHYGLGKAANDLHDYETAMRHFDLGNELNYQVHIAGHGYDRSGTEESRAKIVRLFTREFLESHHGLGSPTRVPIFVVGMIRSGTTLVEQILSSHAEVGGAGEQRFWVNEIPNVVDLDAGTLDAVRFVEMRDRYLRVLRAFQADSPRITDKMPLNFYCAGLIHLAFPNSPIVHIRRNPIDTALSIWMTDLSRPPDFAHRKRNIVDEYRNYLALMEHWRSVIPPTRLLEIHYEDLVRDQERWTRRMLEFCGLDWDPDCMQFYGNNRTVNTPSNWQVRQPIYRTSVDRWRNYEPWLGEFAELAGLDDGCPSAGAIG